MKGLLAGKSIYSIKLLYWIWWLGRWQLQKICKVKNMHDKNGFQQKEFKSDSLFKYTQG